MATPIERYYYIIDSILIVIIGIYSTIIIFTKVHLKEKSFFYYVYFISIFYILYSAFRAKTFFDQPIYLGILAQRAYILLNTSLIAYYFINENKVTINNLIKIFKSIAWLSLVIYSIIYFFFKYIFIETKYLSYDPLLGYRFKFQIYLIIFISFFHLFEYLEKSNILSLVKFIISIFFFMFVCKGRGLNIVMMITILVVIFKEIKKINKAVKLYLLITVIIIGLFGYLYIKKDIVQVVVHRMSDIIMVLQELESSDVSANARLYQSKRIEETWQKNSESLLLGVGFLSNYLIEGEKRGYDIFYGYLRPTDVGIKGVMFVYGIIGTIFVLIIPTIIIFREIIRNISNNDIFIKSSSYFLLYILISSIYTGEIVFNPYFVYFILGILKGIRDFKKNKLSSGYFSNKLR